MSNDRLLSDFSFDSSGFILRPNTDNESRHAAGLAAGITEAVTVVTTMEVLKVRLQGQKTSDTKAGEVPKYRNAAHAAYVIAREEGPRALFKGMSLTALRQATNVSGIFQSFPIETNHLTSHTVNLTTYTKLKQKLHDWQPMYEGQDLPTFQTALCGLIAGAAGPMSNAPIDTLSTSVLSFYPTTSPLHSKISSKSNPCNNKQKP